MSHHTHFEFVPDTDTNAGQDPFGGHQAKSFAEAAEKAASVGAQGFVYVPQSHLVFPKVAPLHHGPAQPGFCHAGVQTIPGANHSYLPMPGFDVSPGADHGSHDAHTFKEAAKIAFSHGADGFTWVKSSHKVFLKRAPLTLVAVPNPAIISGVPGYEQLIDHDLNPGRDAGSHDAHSFSEAAALAAAHGMDGFVFVPNAGKVFFKRGHLDRSPAPNSGIQSGVAGYITSTGVDLNPGRDSSAHHAATLQDAARVAAQHHADGFSWNAQAGQVFLKSGPITRVDSQLPFLHSGVRVHYTH